MLDQRIVHVEVQRLVLPIKLKRDLVPPVRFIRNEVSPSERVRNAHAAGIGKLKHRYRILQRRSRPNQKQSPIGSSGRGTRRESHFGRPELRKLAGNSIAGMPRTAREQQAAISPSRHKIRYCNNAARRRDPAIQVRIFEVFSKDPDRLRPEQCVDIHRSNKIADYLISRVFGGDRHSKRLLDPLRWRRIA